MVDLRIILETQSLQSKGLWFSLHRPDQVFVLTSGPESEHLDRAVIWRTISPFVGFFRNFGAEEEVVEEACGAQVTSHPHLSFNVLC